MRVDHAPGKAGASRSRRPLTSFVAEVGGERCSAFGGRPWLLVDGDAERRAPVVPRSSGSHATCTRASACAPSSAEKAPTDVLMIFTSYETFRELHCSGLTDARLTRTLRDSVRTS